jgi:acetyl-CoA decarbonylase/synthase complex subunit delta
MEQDAQPTIVRNAIMPFNRKSKTFNPIGAVSFGDGERAVTLGGGNTLPLYFFDAKPSNLPAVGIEITDTGADAAGLPLLAASYDGATTLTERAVRAANLKGVDFVCLRFEGADPFGLNRSAEACAKLAQEVAAACPKPLCITGCKNAEKDTELFKAMGQALQGHNVLFLSAKEENYKTVGAATALAYGHKLAAESAVDINLAKQLNILMIQLGIPKGSIVMNLGSAAAGYGFEYLSSVMDLVKAAALEQGDGMLQMPVITPVSTEAWSVKESILPQADMPEWGDMEQRGIQMETVTAAACLASGSDAVILRHPVSVEKTAALIAALV